MDVHTATKERRTNIVRCVEIRGDSNYKLDGHTKLKVPRKFFIGQYKVQT